MYIDQLGKKEEVMRESKPFYTKRLFQRITDKNEDLTMLDVRNESNRYPDPESCVGQEH